MDASSLLPAFIHQVKDLAQAAGSVHRALHKQTKKHQSEPLVSDLKAVAGLVLRLTGILHSLLLLLQALGDTSSQCHPPSKTGLSCLALCADLLSGLERQWQDDEAAQETDLAEAGSLRRFHEDLLAVLTRINIALHSPTWEVAMATLSDAPPSPIAPAEQQNPALMVISNRAPPEAQPLIRANWTYHHSNTKLQWLLDQRCKGTAEWLLDIAVVEQWLEGRHRFALLSGSAGCGKTVLSATFLQQLGRRVATHSTPLCYHLISPHETNRLCDILQPLVLQVLTQHPKAWKAYVEFLLSRKILLDQESFPQLSCLKDVNLLVPLLKNLLSLSDKAYIILDGLDGLESNTFCNLLETLLDCKNLRILALSRPLDREIWEPLCRQLQDKAEDYAVCEIVSSLDDIQAYFRERATQIINSLSTPAMTADMLESFVLDTMESLPDSQAQTNFHAVKCRLWYLQNRHRFREPPIALLKPDFPGTSHLYDFYKAVIESIGAKPPSMESQAKCDSEHTLAAQENHDTLKTALEWLLAITRQGSETPNMACSKKAFFEGLSIAVCPHTKSMDELTPSHELEAQWSWLFDHFACEIPVKTSIDQSRDGYGDMMKPQRYCINNRSFIEFAQTGVYHLDAAEGRLSIAIACLRFLNMSDHSVKRSKRQTAAIRFKHPFYDFAAAWWPNFGNGACHRIQSLAVELFEGQQGFLNWLDAYSRTHYLHGSYGGFRSLSPLRDSVGDPGLLLDHAHTALNVAASLGLSQILAPLDANLEQFRQLFPRLYTSKHESLALLQLALAGPQVLMLTPAHSTVHSPAIVSAAAGPLSIDIRGTITYILDRSTECEEDVRIPSLAAHALIACAELQDSGLLIRIAERFSGKFHGRGIIYTKSFADTLKSLDVGRFLDFQNDICQYISDHEIAFHAKNPNTAWFESDSDSVEGNNSENNFEDDLDKEEDKREKDFGIFDRCTPASLAQLAWQIGIQNKLDCARIDIDRRIDCDDSQYLALWDRTHRQLEVDWIKSLLRDPRRCVTRPLDDSENRWSSNFQDIALQTPLHLLAEVNQADSEIMMWIESLLRFGADPNARDGRGRTPLHLVEAPDVLEILLSFGADLNARDQDGRTIWHVAAYNRDVAILKTLKKLDPDPLKSLRVITTNGRTPLAETLANFETLTRLSRDYQACIEILSICPRDPAYFASDVPIIHFAAVWGEVSLLQQLDEAGAVCSDAITSDGETAYHFLPTHASPELAMTLARIYGTNAGLLTKLDQDGLTAVERWILNFIDHTKFSRRKLPRFQNVGIDGAGYPSRKACLCILEILLAPSVGQSKTSARVTFWERFLYNCLPKLFDPKVTLDLAELESGHVEYTKIILEAILKSHAIEFYEQETSKCALTPLVSNSSLLEHVSENPIAKLEDCFCEFIGHILEKTQHVGDVSNNPTVADLLCIIAPRGYRTLAIKLLEKGVGADTVGLKGESFLDKMVWLLMEEFLAYLEVLAHVHKEGMQVVLSTLLDRLLHKLIREERPWDRHGLEKIKAVLNAGADVNSVESNGESALMLAADIASQDCVIYLLDNGADPFGCHESDRLYISQRIIMRRCKEVLWVLLFMYGSRWDWTGPSFNLSLSRAEGSQCFGEKHGCLAVHVAAKARDIAMLNFFLESGLMPVDSRCEEGLTPLHFAVVVDDGDTIEYLVRLGADKNAVDADGLTPLHYAASAGNFTAAEKMLESGCDPNRLDSLGRTPLMIAQRDVAKFGRNLARLIKNAMVQSQPEAIAPGPSPSADQAKLGGQDGFFLSYALEQAIVDHDLAAVRELIEFGCCADTPRPDCTCTALMFAIGTSFTEAAELLLSSETKDLHSWCSMHSEFEKGDFSVLKKTAISVCKRGGRTEQCLKLVLDIALRQQLNWVAFRQDWSLIHEVSFFGTASGLDVILEHIHQHAETYSAWLPEIFKSSVSAQTVGSLEMGKMLISHLLNESNVDGSKPLHLAVSTPQTQPWAPLKCYALIRHGANVNARNDFGSTALHLAVRTQDILSIRILLDHGADVEMRNGDCETPFDVAVFEYRSYICRMLIEIGGADVSVRGRLGRNLFSRSLPTEALLEGLENEGRRSPIKTFAYLTQLSLARAARHEGNFPDPHTRDASGFASLHYALSFREMAALVFNGPYDFARLAAPPDLLCNTHSIVSRVINDGNGRLMLPRLFRRWPRLDWLRCVNKYSPISGTPLCALVRAKGFWEARWLLAHGAQPDIEGCLYGTPLMLACSMGQLKMVKLLILEGGACVSYMTRTEAGDCEVRNAIAQAAKSPEIVRWLLVGRYMEQAKIAPDSAQSHCISYWSGPWRVEYALRRNWCRDIKMSRPGIDRTSTLGIALCLAKARSRVTIAPESSILKGPAVSPGFLEVGADIGGGGAMLMRGSLGKNDDEIPYLAPGVLPW